MPNDAQFKVNTLYLATRGVREYRETIPFVVRPGDRVLEVGCEWGTTTTLIAATGASVIGTDVSGVCIERARKEHSQIRFETLDAFDVSAAMALGSFTKVYMDLSGLSGYRGLLDLIALLQMYATVIRPETIVVKSGGLKHFARFCRPWRHGEWEVGS